MMIVAVLFAVGLSGAAQAKTLYLQCGSTELVIQKNKNGDYSLKYNNQGYNNIITNDLSIKIYRDSLIDDDYISISRINLSYREVYKKYNYIDDGYCQEGRKF